MQMDFVSLTNNSTNCYLIRINDGWLLIDTGLPDTLSQLLQLLTQKDISIYEINYLMITHFHPDHAGLTQNLRDLGTNLIIHEKQLPYLNKLNAFYKKNPRANFRDIMTSNYTLLTDSNSGSFLSSIGIDGSLISTPGHSDDSISLVIDGCCAFTGDLPAFQPAVAYEDMVTEDLRKTLQQYHVATIYPGHGDPYPLGS